MLLGLVAWGQRGKLFAEVKAQGSSKLWELSALPLKEDRAGWSYRSSVLWAAGGGGTPALSSLRSCLHGSLGVTSPHIPVSLSL